MYTYTYTYIYIYIYIKYKLARLKNKFKNICNIIKLKNTLTIDKFGVTITNEKGMHKC